MRCAQCKYFGAEILVDDWENDRIEVPSGFHTCDFIKHADTDLKLLASTEKSVVQDMSGCFAALRVKEDFGCVNFTPKEASNVVNAVPAETST